MNQSISIVTYPFKDIHKALIQELVSKKASFAISEFNDARDMSVAVESIERIIEGQGLKYRVYDDVPYAAMINMPLSPLDSFISKPKSTAFFGLIGAITGISHRNKFSGYRLGKSFNTLSAIWQQ